MSALATTTHIDLATGEITHQVVKRVGQAMSVVRGTVAAPDTDYGCRKIQRPETELWVRTLRKFTEGKYKFIIDFMLNFILRAFTVLGSDLELS